MDEKYLIYKLKDQLVRAAIPERLGGFMLHGHVDNIERDVLNNRIVLTVDHKAYVFREPKLINKIQNTIIFTYGDVNSETVSDSELFDEIRNGGHIDDILKRTTTDDLYCIKFDILPKDDSYVPVRKPVRKVSARHRTLKTKKRRARRNVKKYASQRRRKKK